MSSFPVAHTAFRRPRARRFNYRTAASLLALTIGLTACASGHQGPSAADTADKSGMLLKIADETNAAGDPATAASLYRELHDLSPKDPVPLARLAATAMAMQDYRTAAEAYRASIALDPNNGDYHRGLALALLAFGDAQSAMTEVRAALQKHGDDPRLYNALGVAEDMAGRHDLAQEAYHHGLDIAPSNAGLRNNYAMSLALAGNYAQAVQELGGIAGPDAPARYRLNLALAYGLAGDDVHAAATARAVLDEASVQSNLAYYGLLRGMDEAHRTAAILASELHGAGAAQVATEPANPSNAHVDAAPPAAAAATPVATAVLPAPVPPPDLDAKADLPLLPTEGASDPHHVATVAPKARTAATPKSSPPALSSEATPKTAPAPKTASTASPAPAAAKSTDTGMAPSADTALKTPPKTDAIATAQKPVSAETQTTSAAMSPPAITPAPATPIAATTDTASSPPPKTDAATAEKPVPAEKQTASAAPAPTAPVAAAADTTPNAPHKTDTATAEKSVPAETPAASTTTSQPQSAPEPASPIATAAPAPAPAAEPKHAPDPAPATPDAAAAAPAPQPTSQEVSPQSGIANPSASWMDENAAVASPAAAPASASTLAALTTQDSEVARRRPGRITVERFTVQLGSFALEDSARRLADEFAAKGVLVVQSRSSDPDGRQWFVVRSGEFDNAADANGVLDMIRSMGQIEPIVVRHRITEPAAPAA